jgi:general secretion pathway protein A
MYERFFGFRERPFDLSPNPRFLVLTDSHREVLSNLEYGIASRKGVTLVLGEAGSGKTTLIRTVIDRQPQRVHSVHVSNPTLSRQEFVETLASRFGLSPRACESKATFLRELEALLASRHVRGETTVLIVDEAQSLPMELLEEIRLLANTETNEEKLLPVILAGQPELADRLNDQSLRQLKQRVALRCELRPLSDRETAGYVAGRIAVAGGVASQVFTREAVSLIHQASNGLPRMVSVLADNALLGGFAKGQKPVGSQVVLEVCRDFDLHSAPARSTAVFAPPAAAAAAPPARGESATHPPAAAAAATPAVLETAPTQPAPRLTTSGLITVPPPEGPGLLSLLSIKGKRFFTGN